VSSTHYITDAEIEATTRFFACTFNHIRRLHECQRHEAARDSLVALRRLAATIRETGSVHGFMPDVLFGDFFADLESIA
jgi:hypothetical protein